MAAGCGSPAACSLLDVCDGVGELERGDPGDVARELEPGRHQDDLRVGVGADGRDCLLVQQGGQDRGGVVTGDVGPGHARQEADDLLGLFGQLAALGAGLDGRGLGRGPSAGQPQAAVVFGLRGLVGTDVLVALAFDDRRLHRPLGADAGDAGADDRVAAFGRDALERLDDPVGELVVGQDLVERHRQQELSHLRDGDRPQVLQRFADPVGQVQDRVVADDALQLQVHAHLDRQAAARVTAQLQRQRTSLAVEDAVLGVDERDPEMRSGVEHVVVLAPPLHDEHGSLLDDEDEALDEDVRQQSDCDDAQHHEQHREGSTHLLITSSRGPNGPFVGS